MGSFVFWVGGVQNGSFYLIAYLVLVCSNRSIHLGTLLQSVGSVDPGGAGVYPTLTLNRTYN